MHRICAFLPSASPLSRSSNQSNSVAIIRPPAQSQTMTAGFSSSYTKLNMVNYSAKWIDLLSPHLDITPPGKIEPPRSGAVSFSIDDRKIFTFGGYAEEVTSPDRYVVNDLWMFVPYNDALSEWGWTKVAQDYGGYIPGPRLATAMATLQSSSKSVLLGGWDPQEPGTGGIILDDVSVLDVETMQWFQPTSVEHSGQAITIPGGPTSRHIAVPIVKSETSILVHNHRCDDHVLLLSISSDGSDKIKGTWTRQTTSGNAPSSRGLHCAAGLHDWKSDVSTGVVIFGGAAKDGDMSNEAFVLDLSDWKWTKLICSGNKPSPRAGACLCSLDENTVLLFGGAERGEGGLVGLNDVWALAVDMKNGRGEWKCLIENKSVEDGSPPGRNAATLTRIEKTACFPNSVLNSNSLDVTRRSHFLLQGGWNPFRKTYNDVFVLCVESE